MTSESTDRTRAHDVLLLDFGGVCLLNPVELHRRTEELLGLDANSLSWMGPIDPSTDDLWQRMVVGDGLTERDYWQIRAEEVGAAAGRELTVRDYMSLLYDPPTPEIIRPAAMSTLHRAKAAGYGVSVLTNDMRAFHGRQWEQGIAFLGLVDHIVDCSDTNVLKPDRRAFERAVAIVGAPAERILFVDDQPINVDGGTAAGLDSVWFDVANAGSAWADIDRRLGI